MVEGTRSVTARKRSSQGRGSYRLRPPEDALRPDDQHDHQDQEADRDLPAGVDEQRRPLGHHAQHESRNQGPEGVTDAAEDDRREDRQQQLEAELGRGW